MNNIRWQKRLKWKRASAIAIIASIVVLALFAAFTVYGNKVGNFVINVDNDKDIHLSLSVEENLSSQTERLAFDGLAELGDTTYLYLPDDIAAKGIGDKSVPKSHMAYSFYLINNSDRAVDYIMELKMVDVVGEPLKIMRVMLIEGDASTFAEGNRIYALPETTEEAEQHLETQLARYKTYQAEPFLLDQDMIFSIDIKDMEQGAVQKYTVVVWIEGCDMECTNAHLGDRIKMELDITGQ